MTVVPSSKGPTSRFLGSSAASPQNQSWGLMRSPQAPDSPTCKARGPNDEALDYLAFPGTQEESGLVRRWRQQGTSAAGQLQHDSAAVLLPPKRGA